MAGSTRAHRRCDGNRPSPARILTGKRGSRSARPARSGAAASQPVRLRAAHGDGGPPDHRRVPQSARGDASSGPKPDLTNLGLLRPGSRTAETSDTTVTDACSLDLRGARHTIKEPRCASARMAVSLRAHWPGYGAAPS